MSEFDWIEFDGIFSYKNLDYEQGMSLLTDMQILEWDLDDTDKEDEEQNAEASIVQVALVRLTEKEYKADFEVVRSLALWANYHALLAQFVKSAVLAVSPFISPGPVALGSWGCCG
jgi:hypothetical protein